MQILETDIADVKKLIPKVFHDERGFFYESYRRSLYHDMGINVEFVQDNHSYSKKGTLRGMHFQSDPGQAKLVMVVTGAIYDVFVDIRKDSSTFGKWGAAVLDGEKREQLFVPKGFAHGFYVLSQEAHVVYKVSSVYNSATEMSFRYDDPDVGIDWPHGMKIISSRDEHAPSFRELFS